MTDDLHTRLSILERTAVSRETLVEREEKLLERMEALLNRHNLRTEESLQHTLKGFGHEMADQLRQMRDRIGSEHDAKLKAEIAAIQSAPARSGDFLTRWGLPLGVATLVGGPGTAMQLYQFLSAVF